jgi:tetratricopeptide (TPR) repeat protein
MRNLLANILMIFLSLGLVSGGGGCQTSKESTKTQGKAPMSPEALQHLQQGHKYLSENKIAEAQKEFQEVVRLASDNPLGHLWLGKVYLSQKEYPRAEAELKKVLALDPENYPAMILLGRLYSGDKERLNQAEEYLQQALKLSPDSLEAHFDLGRLYALKGERQKAIAAFNFIFFKENEFFLYHYEVGRILESWEERAEALKQYRRAYALNPNLFQAKEALERLEKGSKPTGKFEPPGKPSKKSAFSSKSATKNDRGK